MADEEARREEMLLNAEGFRSMHLGHVVSCNYCGALVVDRELHRTKCKKYG